MAKDKDVFYLKMWDYLSCYFILLRAKQIKLYIYKYCVYNYIQTATED